MFVCSYQIFIHTRPMRISHTSGVPTCLCPLHKYLKPDKYPLHHMYEMLHFCPSHQFGNKQHLLKSSSVLMCSSSRNPDPVLACVGRSTVGGGKGRGDQQYRATYIYINSPEHC